MLPSHFQHSLCLFHFTCKVSFSRTPYPHSSHLGISQLISLHCPSSPSQTQTFPRRSDCSLLRKASIMPHTQWHWWSTSHPASSGMGGEHPPPLLGGCLSFCPSFAYTHSPCRERPSRALSLVSFLETSHPVTVSCPPACELLPLPAQSHAPRTAKQQCCSGMVIAEDGSEAFSRVKKTLLLWGLAGRTVLSLWPHSVTFSGNISSSRWETLPNTHNTEAALSPLGTTPSLLHAKGTVWNKKASEPSYSRQCHHWGCSHKATVKLAGQRGMRKD